MARRILVTSALPYANGPIHLGHLLEAIYTDIWVRFQRLRGHQCLYVCADDAHGTATMLLAEAEGIDAETLIERLRQDHVRDYQGFNISHDNYHSTHSPENQARSEQIFARLQERGLIFTKDIEQLYDPQRELFLADRFVKGECPRCGDADQNGDNCDNCGATYDATELKNPYSTLSGATPELRSSQHYFFDLPQYEDMLRSWTASDAVQPEVQNKLAEWLDAGLKPWDISRDAPYFGFVIPGTEDKYFYVWMDAPIGYMASFEKLAASRNDVTFAEFWEDSSNTELHHVIGKDIVNFHCLFWPAVLDGAGYRKPTRVHTHGFITVTGTKMSKSRGTFIEAGRYLEHLNPEYLRYYYATKLNGTVDDMDINLDDFVQRVNSDLVGKVVNIASRCAGFINKQFDGRLAPTLHDPDLQATFVERAELIAERFEAGDTSKAVREITALADLANQYIAQHAPWALIKEDGQRDTVHGVCSQGINLFRLLVIYLKPILPQMAADAEAFLQVEPLTWADLDTALLDTEVAKFKPLFTRMEKASVDQLLQAQAESAAQADAPAAAAPDTTPADATEAEHISIDDFAKVQLRVAKILDAQPVEGADKLLRLTLDIGDHERQVLAGIKAAYAADDPPGRLCVVVANLAPRKMRFGTSEGMVLAAGPGGEDIFLLSPDSGATPGMIVR